jgi:hypothetical protein
MAAGSLRGAELSCLELNSPQPPPRIFSSRFAISPVTMTTQAFTVRLDLTRVPEDQRNETLLSLKAAVERGLAFVDLTIGASDVPALRELVRHVRGSLKVSARNWRPTNVLHVISGLDSNRGGLSHLSLDWEGCNYSDKYFRALVEAIGRHEDLETFELCMYQDVREADIVLDDSVGEAVGDLLTKGTLKHLRLVNWFGYVASSGFVREMSRGLASSTTLVSLELRNCALPCASYSFLTSALRSKESMLTNMTVGIESATLGEVRELLETLKDHKSLRSVRISPCLLPIEADAVSMLELAVRENTSIHYVDGLSPALRKPRWRRLEMLLEANRFVSQYRAVLDAPDQVSPQLWPTLLARLGGQCHKTRPDDLVVRRHYAHHLAQLVRTNLPWLLAQSFVAKVCRGAATRDCE